jgi:hypothetical protein
VRPEPERWFGQLASAVLVIVILWLFFRVHRTPMQLIERRACERLYQDARTAAETLAIDARPPMPSQRPDSVTLPCGALRKAGRL